MKDFRQELYKFYEKLKQGNPFCLTKNADGEKMILEGRAVNNNEFNFQGEEFYSRKLREALQFQDPDYFVGISCCCGPSDAAYLRELSQQPLSNLTFANIWVNANHKEYKRLFFPEFAKRDVILIANENSQIQNLPFEVEKFYPVKNTAFIQNYDIVQELIDEDYKDKLILLCSGPLGNLVGHQLWRENKKNTILDLGSSLNDFLNSAGFVRDYLVGGYYSNRVCEWID